MRQYRTSGSVEGVMGNHDPYSDPAGGDYREGKQAAEGLFPQPARTTVHLPPLTTGPSKWIPVTCLLKRRYRANRWPGAKTADASDDAGLRVADNIVRRI